ncbi:MAG: nucleotidyl transferase AbiEii/AbiGii toxin family protein [Pseudomonadota bacterium]
MEDRQATLQNISDALERIKKRIEAKLPNAKIAHKSDIGKLLIRADREEIKLEVNLVGRGTIETPAKMMLCEKAQEMYDTSSVIQIVPLGQLYGGKICAALDRQHPRDLFDIKLLIENEGFVDSIKKGFLLSLCSSDRPIHEVLVPNLQDQRQAMENQFTGMSEITFNYDDFEETRRMLIEHIKQSLNDNDKAFLLGFNNTEPDWTYYDFKQFPAVRWKLQNLKKFKDVDPEKYEQQHKKLIVKLR